MCYLLNQCPTNDSNYSENHLGVNGTDQKFTNPTRIGMIYSSKKSSLVDYYPLQCLFFFLNVPIKSIA